MKNLTFVTKIILSAFVALFINACDTDEKMITNHLTGNWKVISFENYETSSSVTKTEENTWTQFNNGDITVSFDESGPTGGVMSGINVTNSFSGSYTIGSAGAIAIKNVGWTKINEPEWGKLFHSIENAETYELVNGRLRIFYNNKKNSINFEKIDK